MTDSSGEAGESFTEEVTFEWGLEDDEGFPRGQGLGEEVLSSAWLGSG